MVEASRLVYREPFVIPKELSLAWIMFRGTLRGLWRLTRWAVRHRAPVAVVAGLVWADVALGWRLTAVIALSLLAVVGTVLAVWQYRSPVSFEAKVAARVRGWLRWRLGYARRWRRVMQGCGLVRVFDGREVMPQIATVRSTGVVDVLVVRLAVGQVPDQVAEQAEALREAFGVWRVDVRSIEPGWVRLTVLRTDPLAVPVAVAHPRYAADLAAVTERQAVSPEGVLDLLDGVPVAVTESGGVYRLPVRGGHVLVAGTTGSGKSGLLWAVLRGLHPLITSGYVTVTGLDPKWMELSPARSLAEIVTDVAVMPEALEHLVAEMDTRCRALEGTTRLHVPSPAAPHRVIVIDELATITALATRQARERVEAALGHLVSRGRAAGYTVIVTTVEPTKEVVRWRGLHRIRVAFRMEEPTHADMVLGEGARDRGAHCDTIDMATPGIAYVKIDGDPTPVRIRVVHVSDYDVATLTACAERDLSTVAEPASVVVEGVAGRE